MRISAVCFYGIATVREKIWKMEFSPDQGKVREFCGWPGKFRKNLESEGKVKEFGNKWLWQSSKQLYILLTGKKAVLSEFLMG